MKEVLRVNAAYKVDNASIQRIQHNGREHIVIPSFTLPDNVIMNGGLYPADEIAKSFTSLLGTPAPIGHPVINGKAVSAKRMDAINAHYVGVWNEKVEYDASSKRVYVEKWVDVEFAEKFAQGKRLLDAINAGLPLHTSTGLHCRREQVTNGAAGYTWIARDMVFDHDAILFDEPGAATPDDGVGLMVNSAELVVNAMLPTLQTNAALPNSYGQKREALQAALREVFGNNDCNPWVEDFNDSAVIFHQNGYKMVAYELDGPAIVLGDTVTEMQARTEFVAKGATVVTTLALTGNSVECEPVKPIDEPENPDAMNKEELQAAIAEAVGPLTARIDALTQENASLRTEMETNANKGDAALRASIIAAKPELEMVANSLKGEALETLAASFATAAPIAAGTRIQTNSDATAKAGFGEYEGA